MNQSFEPRPPKSNTKKFVKIFFVLLLVLGMLLVTLYVSRKRYANTNTLIDKTLPTSTPTTLSFEYSNLDLATTFYSAAVSSSPSLIDEQRAHAWTPLECIQAPSGNFTKNRIPYTDKNLEDALKTIESFPYSEEITEPGTKIMTELYYSHICKDQNTYYILYVTNSYKTHAFVRSIHAAGGSAGNSNLAVVDASGKTTIYTNLASKLVVPAIQELSPQRNPTYRILAYFGCGNIVGKLGNSIFIECGGGDGPISGNGIYKIILSPFQLVEYGYCTWLLEPSEYHCYDKTGKLYYKWKSS
jgi:hypothetical protein